MPRSLGVLTPQHPALLIQVVRTLHIPLGGELIPGKKVIRNWVKSLLRRILYQPKVIIESAGRIFF